MRRAAGVALAVALALPAAADSHLGHGPTPVDVTNFAFAPADVTVVAGDLVIWSWPGPGTNHSVTSDTGPAEGFDSDPGKSPASIAHPLNDGFSHTFTSTGAFTYHCKVHPQMTGTVRVIPPTVGADRTAPVISRIRIFPRTPCSRRSKRCRFAGASMYYTASEESELALELRRRGASEDADPLRSADVVARRGRNRLALPIRNLRPGIYRITMSALDGAQNLSRVVRLSLTIR